jgi:hypothetical protein
MSNHPVFVNGNIHLYNHYVHFSNLLNRINVYRIVKINKNEILTSDKIREINDALMIMRHFVDLSARLLPFLAELQSKENPSEKDQADKNKIVQVFNTYNFDTATSDILIRSPILLLIKNSYRDLLTCESSDVDEVLADFRNEYKRLKKNWRYARMN